MEIVAMTAEHDLMPYLLVAMDWRDEGVWTPERVRSLPEVAHYIDGWMRPGDLGLLAADGDMTLGAAWWRTFAAEDPGYGFVSVDVPEIGLGVLPGARGRAVGSRLLDALILEARTQGLTGISLSVEDGNATARGMYERRGFDVVGREGDSDTMLLRL